MSLKVRKNFIKIIYTVLSRVLSSRTELYPSWDAYYPMLGVQFVNFPFLSYCAASLAMLVSESKRILKFHLREHVTNVRDMGWNNFSSFEESSSVPEKTFQ